MATAPNAASKSVAPKAKYGVREKYVRLAKEMRHSTEGSREEIAADSRQTYHNWRDARERADREVKD